MTDPDATYAENAHVAPAPQPLPVEGQRCEVAIMNTRSQWISCALDAGHEDEWHVYRGFSSELRWNPLAQPAPAQDEAFNDAAAACGRLREFMARRRGLVGVRYVEDFLTQIERALQNAEHLYELAERARAAPPTPSVESDSE